MTRELITEDDRAVSLLAQVGSSAPLLGNVLVDRGVLDQTTLEQQLEALTFAIVASAAAQPREGVSYDASDASDQPDTLPEVTTRQLILVAARAALDLEAKRRYLDRRGGPLEMVGDVEALIHDLHLDPTEAFLLSMLREPRSVEGLRVATPLADAAFVNALYALTVAGVARPVEGERHRAGATMGSKPPVRGASRAGGTTSPPPSAATSSTTPASDDTPVEREPTSPSARLRRPLPPPERERDELQRLASRIEEMNHYQALGVPAGASYQEVLDTWEDLRIRYDPGRASEPHLRDMAPQLRKVFEHMEYAFDTLFTPAKRLLYDRILDSRPARTRGTVPGSGVTARPQPKATPERARAELVQANLKQADHHLARGELHQAYTFLRQVCDLDPKPAHLLKLAQLMLRNRLWTGRALDTLRRALEVDPRYVPAWLELAGFWQRQGNVERERKALERAITADPDNSTALTRHRELAGPTETDALRRRVRRS